MPPMNTLPNPTLNPQARNPWAIVQALRDGDVNPDDVQALVKLERRVESTTAGT